jgi:cytochrome c-type biogenesis protein CcmH/NrfG
LGKNDTAGAIRAFSMNAQEFPRSANVWDSLAEAYLKSGDRKTAKHYYEKSLKLDPENKNAREMLAKLRATAGK